MLLRGYSPFIDNARKIGNNWYSAGDIAQLVRALALQARSQGFESPYLQKFLQLPL